MPNDPSDPPPARSERRERLYRTAARHPELPEDVIEKHVVKADDALELLGPDEELVETAEDALDRNLETVERAIDDGAGTSGPARDRDDPGE